MSINSIKKINIYTLPTCPHCRQLKKFLNKYGVSYKEISVENGGKALSEMEKKSKQSGVPVIELNGKIIVGFDPDEMTRELGLGKG